MNFESGTSLAVFQDMLIDRYNKGGSITPAEMSRLKENYWVTTAATAAPSNLVVRQWCLIDLFSKTKVYETKIMNQLKTISPEGLWLEGYSYWIYTKMALIPYGVKSTPVQAFNANMDQAFIRSSYIGPDGQKWPAPYGDLRKMPLEPGLQRDDCSNVCDYGFLKKNGPLYTIQARYLGCNTHTPKASVIQIVNGVPKVNGTVEFKWYEGYDVKYPSKVAEIADTFSIKRLTSIFRR